MKQSIYQKLLLSLAFMAFLGTMVSAQVLSGDQVNPTQIHSKQQMMTDLKVKAKAQGLKEIPQAWIDEAVQQQITERRSARTTAKSALQTDRQGQQGAEVKSRERVISNSLQRKKTAKNPTDSDSSPFGVAKRVNQKLLNSGQAARAKVVEVGGKYYVQMRPIEKTNHTEKRNK